MSIPRCAQDDDGSVEDDGEERFSFAALEERRDDS